MNRRNICLLLIFFLSSVTLVFAQYQSPFQAITYINCSSIYCTHCLNQYQCAVCMYNDQPICCPKFCIQCLDMNTCIKCNPLFALILVNNSIVCTRIMTPTDPNCQFVNTYVENITNSCFNCNFPNCLICNSYMNCSQCLSGYYLFNLTNLQTIVPQITPICKLCMPNCINCTNSVSCLSCAAQYFYNGSSCVACGGQFCFSCDGNALNCTQCIRIAYLNGSQCSLCSSIVANCSYCNFESNQIMCTDCEYSMYWNGTQCLSCLGNCQLCSLSDNEVVCRQCNVGYAINNSTKICEPCLKGCRDCVYNNAMSCNQCNNGYVTTYNETTQNLVCIPCIWPCFKCYNDTSACAICQIGFYLNLQSINDEGNSLTIGQCYFCSIENCLTCTSATSCTQCEDGYYVNYSPATNSQICSPCPENCVLCGNNNTSPNSTSEVQCFLCASGYANLPNNNDTCASCNISNCLFCIITNIESCVQCEPGYRLNTSSSGTQLFCVQCTLQNCLFCLSLNTTLPNGTFVNFDTCEACNTSHFSQLNPTLNSSYCTPCPQNCLICQNETYCQNCSDGYYLSPKNPQLCLLCPAQCLTCDQSGNCLFCSDNYYPQNMQSVSTNPPRYVNCLPCSVIQGCLLCYNDEFCKRCTSQRFSVLPGIEGNCLSCPNGCIQCNNEQQCQLCDDGYILIEQPNGCLQQIGWPIWAIFSCCVLGFAFLFVIVEKVVRKVRGKSKESQSYIQFSSTMIQKE